MAWRLTIDVTDTRILPGNSLNEWIVEGDGPPPLLELWKPMNIQPESSRVVLKAGHARKL